MPGCYDVSGITRRRFIGAAALATAGSFFLPRMMMAGPFEPGDFQKFVPADKKLTDAWVKSLFERGVPTVFRGSDLQYIGMPVGGICTGQLYLGGDGELWHWDIFNHLVRTEAGHYKEPLVPEETLDQGFAVRVISGATPETRSLSARGFPGVTFCGEYPIGTVVYEYPAFPLKVTLEAFSPFIPLDLADSSLPATVMQFTVKNISAEKVEAELGGWMENFVSHRSCQLFSVLRTNREVKADGAVLLECGLQEVANASRAENRPVIVFEDFERGDWGKWNVVGMVFGSGPTEGAPRQPPLRITNLQTSPRASHRQPRRGRSDVSCPAAENEHDDPLHIRLPPARMRLLECRVREAPARRDARRQKLNRKPAKSA